MHRSSLAATPIWLRRTLRADAIDSENPNSKLTDAHKASGYAESDIVALQGEGGIEMLSRQREAFNFGDGEDAIVEFSLQELRAGHYAIGVDAKDRAGALQIASLLEPLGAHSFSYFGTWVNERLTR